VLKAYERRTFLPKTCPASRHTYPGVDLYTFLWGVNNPENVGGTFCTYSVTWETRTIKINIDCALYGTSNKSESRVIALGSQRIHISICD